MHVYLLSVHVPYKNTKTMHVYSQNIDGKFDIYMILQSLINDGNFDVYIHLYKKDLCKWDLHACSHS